MDFSVCANERLEDAFDTLFFHMQFNFGPMTEEHKHSLRVELYNKTGTRPDGFPPRKIVGMLHKQLFVREHHDPVDIFLCYCSMYTCSSDQTAINVWEYINDSLYETAEAAHPEPEATATLGWTSNSPPPPAPPAAAAAPIAAPRVGISLGMTCRAAKLAVEMGLRQTKAQGYRTGPFDMMLSTYEGVVQCLRDDFRHLTAPQHLQLGKDGQLRNTYYNFTFVHESPPYFPYTVKTLKQPWPNGVMHFINDNFLLLKERYNRRIESFLSYLHSGSPIVFLLEIQDEVGSRDCEELAGVLRGKYPGLDFRIQTLWTHHDEDVAALLYDPFFVQ